MGREAERFRLVGDAGEWIRFFVAMLIGQSADGSSGAPNSASISSIVGRVPFN
jgi:hypothetical protein